MPDIYVMDGGISTGIFMLLLAVSGGYVFWRGTWGSRRDEE